MSRRKARKARKTVKQWLLEASDWWQGAFDQE